MEDRTLFQYSQIPEPDKWRGPPSFWNAGDRLFHKNMVQEYLRVKTAEEKGIPPEMQFVRVPDVIKSEKQLFEDYEIKNSKKYKYSQYRRKKSEELKVQRNKYRPHVVEGSGLAVVGKKIASTKRTFPGVSASCNPLFNTFYLKKQPDENTSSSSSLASSPSIIITEDETKELLDQTIPDDVPCCYSRVDIDRESTVCLTINDVELKCVYYPTTSQLFLADTKINEWTLNFKVQPIKTLGSVSLEIENRGTMTIQYSWKMIKPNVDTKRYSNSNVMDHSPWFYFDKNPGIFLPGQKYSLKFHHYSSTPGLHVENWILKTVPAFFSPPVQIKIILIAISEQSYTINDLLAIESYVEKCVANTLAKQIINEIFERALVQQEKLIDYRSFFHEEELFKFQNPKHHYHSEVVNELKMIYAKIAIDPPQEWDLSFRSLRKLLENMEDAEKKSALCKISEMSKALLKPSYSYNKSEGKWNMVYSSLCKIVNLIEEDALYLESCLLKSSLTFNEAIVKSEKSVSESRPIATELQDVKNGSKIVEQNLQKSALYQQCFYTKAYHHLCDAVEQIVIIIESFKIFENRGEIPLNIFEA